MEEIAIILHEIPFLTSMKFLFFIAFSIGLSPAVLGQYYYYDIISNKKLNQDYAELVSSGYKKVVLESFESDNSLSEGFFCEKKFNQDYSESELITKSNATGESGLQTFFRDNKVSKTITTTPHSVNSTSYKYDEAGRLVSIYSDTKGNGDSSSFSEQKIFSYDSSGRLSELAISRNGRRVSLIRFTSDSAGNIIEENPVEGKGERMYYYYYDEKNRLTDIVHFNERAQKLLPDFMFVYDGQGKINQMLSVDGNDRDYNIWRYSYTEKGLPEIQKCYSKEKTLLGTIQFEYYP